MLLGSGADVGNPQSGELLLLTPQEAMVKASEAIVPTALSEAFDGQPFDLQPAPLFSSQ